MYLTNQNYTMKKNTFLLHFIIFSFLFVSTNIFAQLNEGAPAFQGASFIGYRPQTPVSIYFSITGQKPIDIKIANLPAGWQLNEDGSVSGMAGDTGTYELTVFAKNEKGQSERKYSIVIGDKLCLTPPLGWNSWNVFTTNISEKMIMEIADAMVSSGMRDLGYQYINLDDYWHAPTRASDGSPLPDPAKFPNGIKYVADYVHSKGLKLGIYSCAGKMTCGEQFGGYGYEEIDAKTYAAWGIDLVKYDYCYAPWGKKAAIARYNAMGNTLKNCGRSIVFSVCEWGLRKPWKWAQNANGSYWRTTPDIYDVWKYPAIWEYSVMSILNRTEKLGKYASTGAWNDMDMLLVGNYGQGKATSSKGKFKGLSDLEYQSHMSLWAMFNSPLLSSCDLRAMNDATKKILMNPMLLAINQDKLGNQAERVHKKNGIRVYQKSLEDGVAIAILNTKNNTKEFDFLAMKSFDLKGKYTIIDVWNNSNYSSLKEAKLKLAPHETIVLKLTQTNE